MPSAQPSILNSEHSAVARFCWPAGSSTGRNSFTRFRMAFNLKSPAVETDFRLFADTRYRLWINGSRISYGPARFYPAYPEADPVELLAALKPGNNELSVEVWFAGAPIFQAVQAKPVFYAAGWVRTENGERICLDTPGDWTAEPLTSRESGAIPLSFALGPVEVMNLRLDGPTTALSPTDATDTGHALPGLRTIPAVRETIRHPQTVHYAGAGSTGGEVRFGCFRYFGPVALKGPKPHFAWRTWLYSETFREMDIGLFWGDHVLNGQRLSTVDCPNLGNRQTASVKLQAGWNGLAGCTRTMSETWGMLIGLPAAAKVTCHSRPQMQAPAGFQCSDSRDPAWTLEELTALSTDADTALAESWTDVPASSSRLAPARIVGWEAPVDSCLTKTFTEGQSFSLKTGPDGLAILTLGFEHEFYGHPTCTIECAEPFTADFSYDEHLRSDGTVALFQAHFVIHATDRFDCPPGRSTIETFHSRGGRYLQFNLRARPHTSLTVSNISIREFKTPGGETGRFQCNAPFWNWNWEICTRTLEASLEDIWSDSPWREQGCYLGDSYVQFYAHCCLSSDMRLPRRILRLFAQSQMPDGQIQPVVPSANQHVLPDFSLLYVRFVRDYWAETGDLDLIRELWPVTRKILDGSTWHWGDFGLMGTSSGEAFIDWSVEQEARGDFSAVLNFFYLDALACQTELADCLGEETTPWQERYDRLRTSVEQYLWDAPNNRYHCAVDTHGQPRGDRGLHGNTLAWVRGLYPEGCGQALINWILRELDDNAGKIIRHRKARTDKDPRTSGQLEYYFLFFLLEALGQHGYRKEAETIIEDMWGLMQREGAVNCWESVLESYFGKGSQCHSWAVAPMIFAIRYILGVTRPQPGRPDRIQIRPQPGKLQQASGCVPTSCGPIDLRWEHDGEDFQLHVKSPEDLKIECNPPPGWPRDRFHAHLRHGITMLMD